MIVTNQSPFDLFTVVHFAFGIWAGQYLSLSQLALLMVTWEVIERPAKENFPGFFIHPGQDSLANSTTDVVSALAGAAVTKWNMNREGIHGPDKRQGS